MGTSFLEVLIKMANEWHTEKDPTHEQQLDQFPGAHLWNRILLLQRRRATTASSLRKAEIKAGALTMPD